jgi:hypothetical protein
MRQTVVLLLLACLVVRWADAACGCPQHNGWLSLAAGVLGGCEHEEPASDEPAYAHDCCSEGRATYSASARVIVSEAPGLAPALLSPEPNVIVAHGAAEERAHGLDRPPLSRATLQVWRI